MIRKIKTNYTTECYNCHRPLKKHSEVRWYVEERKVRCLEDCKKTFKQKAGSWGNYKHRARRNSRLTSGTR